VTRTQHGSKHCTERKATRRIRPPRPSVEYALGRIALSDVLHVHLEYSSGIGEPYGRRATHYCVMYSDTSRLLCIKKKKKKKRNARPFPRRILLSASSGRLCACRNGHAAVDGLNRITYRCAYVIISCTGFGRLLYDEKDRCATGRVRKPRKNRYYKIRPQTSRIFVAQNRLSTAAVGFRCQIWIEAKRINACSVHEKINSCMQIRVLRRAHAPVLLRCVLVREKNNKKKKKNVIKQQNVLTLRPTQHLVNNNITLPPARG
jgi:hypothetical protein